MSKIKRFDNNGKILDAIMIFRKHFLLGRSNKHTACIDCRNDTSVCDKQIYRKSSFTTKWNQGV